MNYLFRGTISWTVNLIKEVREVISQNAHTMLSFKILNQTQTNNSGVPQGSILGPILFIIDIDFSKASEKLFSILYADDTSVFIEGYEYDKLIEIMK